MKKNVMMRIAAVLLVCVLVTTCGISGTFAKYTSSTNVEASARVAKWGWGTHTLTIDLFKDVYGTNAVVGKDGAKVIAPGTSNSAPLTWTPDANFKPEVAYTITFTAATTQAISADLESRLVWTLQYDEEQEAEYDTFALLVSALEKISYDCAANASAPTINVVIGWKWAFEGNDTTDTSLGNAGELENLVITITLTATQVNPTPAQP